MAVGLGIPVVELEEHLHNHLQLVALGMVMRGVLKVRDRLREQVVVVRLRPARVVPKHRLLQVAQVAYFLTLPVTVLQDTFQAVAVALHTRQDRAVVVQVELVEAVVAAAREVLEQQEQQILAVVVAQEVRQEERVAQEAAVLF